MGEEFFNKRSMLRTELNFAQEQIRFYRDYILEIRKELNELDEAHPQAAVEYSIVEVAHDLKEMFAIMRKIVPTLTLEQMLQAAQGEIDELKRIVEEETTTTTTHRKLIRGYGPGGEILDEDSSESINMTRSKRTDIKKSVPIVINILREAGRPLQLKTILKELNDNHNIQWGGIPSQTMNSIMGYDPRVSRVHRGTYQLKL